MLSASATNVFAVCVLVAIGAGALLYAALLYRRMPLTPLQSSFYWLNAAFARVLWRAGYSGPLPLPPGQGAVIVCNHRSSCDPSFIQITTKRVIHWMIAKEYCVHPALAWFFRTCEVIPVSRGGIDTAATKMAIRLARDGGLVGLFPEGRINTTDRLLLPGRPGAALIALKARVPLLPCYVSGSPYNGSVWGPLLLPAKVQLQFGRLIDTSPFYGRENEREVLEEVTRRFMIEIARLAGNDDYQPELAGRFYKPSLAEP